LVKSFLSNCLIQGRATQVGLWAADQVFCHNLGYFLSKT
jgi:hypothetical protein